MTKPILTPAQGSTFTHAVFTRFNLPIFNGGAAPSEEWLQKRVALFEKYCLPSFLAQTNTSFYWFLLIADDSPLWFIETMDELTKDHEHFEVTKVA